jgi:O-antigen ligase
MGKYDNMGTCQKEEARFEIARKVFFILFMIYTIFLIIFHKAEDEMIANLSGVFLVFVFLGYQLFYTTKTFYFNSMLSAYLLFYLFCVLSLTWSIDTSYSLYTVIRMTQIFINMVLLYNILKVFKVHNAILVGLVIGMLINLLLAIDLIDFIKPIYLKVRYIGTTEHPNTISLYAVFSILASLLLLQSTKNKLFIVGNFINILGALYIILLSGSRASLLISVMIVFSYLVQMLLDKNSRKYLLVLVLVLSIAFLYFVDMEKLAEHMQYTMDRLAGMVGGSNGAQVDSSTEERLSFLHRMIEVFKNNPFLGTGVNTSRVFLNGFYSHNNYIEILGTLGVFALFIYYSAFVHLSWKIMKVEYFWTKYYLTVFLLVIIVFDFAAVTFYSKILLLMVLLLHYLAEENRANI